jgi:heme-degrading monooxygenase HmoA
MKTTLLPFVIMLSLQLSSCQERSMHTINQPYTLGVWSVKLGNEKTFIAEWKAFADWTAKNQPGAGTGHLLQDPERPNQFVSFGPWESVDAIKSWRERAEFKAFVSRVRELCDDFQPRSLTLVAVSGD